MKQINLETTFTPYTLDTYNTFRLDSEEALIEDGKSYDDYDFEYDCNGYLQALAENWIKLMKENILDDVILGVRIDGEVVSPKYYNYTTDHAFIVWDVDYEKLKAYIAKNQEDYDANYIRSCDGFMWFGEEEHTMLHYYLSTKSVKDYSETYYLQNQYEEVDQLDFIEATLIEK